MAAVTAPIILVQNMAKYRVREKSTFFDHSASSYLCSYLWLAALACSSARLRLSLCFALCVHASARCFGARGSRVPDRTKARASRGVASPLRCVGARRIA